MPTASVSEPRLCRVRNLSGGDRPRGGQRRVQEERAQKGRRSRSCSTRSAKSTAGRSLAAGVGRATNRPPLPDDLRRGNPGLKADRVALEDDLERHPRPEAGARPDRGGDHHAAGPVDGGSHESRIRCPLAGAAWSLERNLTKLDYSVKIR